MIYFTKDPAHIQILSTYKGWFFILVTGMLLFFLVRNEIKRRTQIYNELLEAKKKADESDRLKTTFLSNLSHYIRTPMNGILGFVQLLEEKDINPDNHQLFLSYINERSHHLLQTLNSIIEISRIQEGATNLNIQPFEIPALLDMMADSAKHEVLGKSKKINIITKYSPPKGSNIIYSDRDKLGLVFTNLISNAVNFTDKGYVEIGSIKNESEVLFWVEDTGKGIKQERIHSIFTGFLQNTSATCVAGEGAGLGLPLSAGLVNLLGGKIWVENTGVTGTKFCFSIPLNLS